MPAGIMFEDIGVFHFTKWIKFMKRSKKLNYLNIQFGKSLLFTIFISRKSFWNHLLYSTPRKADINHPIAS